MEIAVKELSSRERMHHIIDMVDEDKVEAMLTLFGNLEEDDLDYEFTPEDIKMFDERRENRLSGKSKVYSWQEAKEIISSKNQIK